MRQAGIYMIMLIIPLHLGAQDTTVLTAEAFIDQVRRFHPVAAQARLLTEKADAELLVARGAFDPQVSISSNNKSFDGTTYYHYTNPEIKIPTAAGISLKTGYEKANGQYRNPELTEGVASYAGIELDVLSGFITDKKRTALKQAKIFVQLTEQERLSAINDLLYEAYTAYFEWAAAYQLFRVYNSYATVASKRAQLTALMYKNGDRSVTDTVEALAQLQLYELLQSESQMELNKKLLSLSAFLWSETQEPYILPPSYIPEKLKWSNSLILPDTTNLIEQIRGAHPKLQSVRFKAGMLEAERRLLVQNLLPSLSVQGNLLSRNYFAYKNVDALYFENNYKLGVNFTVPLFLRQGRGQYRNVKLKIQETSLELKKQEWEIALKVKNYYTQAIRLKDQLETAVRMQEAYNTLLRAEELKFSQGESSLFLINTRETKALEMQQKIVDLQQKYNIAFYSIAWALGAVK